MHGQPHIRMNTSLRCACCSVAKLHALQQRWTRCLLSTASKPFLRCLVLNIRRRVDPPPYMLYICLVDRQGLSFLRKVVGWQQLSLFLDNTTQHSVMSIQHTDKELSSLTCCHGRVISLFSLYFEDEIIVVVNRNTQYYSPVYLNTGLTIKFLDCYIIGLLTWE